MNVSSDQNFNSVCISSASGLLEINHIRLSLHMTQVAKNTGSD